MADFGFRMGSQGARMEGMRHPQRRVPRKQWKTPSQDNTDTMDVQGRDLDGLNSMGPTVDGARMQSRQGQGSSSNATVQGTSSTHSTESYKERLQQRRMRQQGMTVQQSQQTQQQGQNIKQSQQLPGAPVVRSSRTPHQQGSNYNIFDASSSSLLPVNVEQVTQDRPQANDGFYGRHGKVIPLQVPAVQPFAGQDITQERFQQESATQELLEKLTKKYDELEKRHHEILVKVQQEEVQRRVLDVSMNAIRKDLVDIQRASDPIGNQDEVRREMRELKQSLTNSMTDTSNRMQEQVRVIMEQTDDVKRKVMDSVEDMLHEYYDMLFWMFATVTNEVGGTIYDQCDFKSTVLHTREVGSDVLLHHPMIEKDNNVWMSCRYVDNTGFSKLGHVCIMQKPGNYNVTNFTLQK